MIGDIPAVVDKGPAQLAAGDHRRQHLFRHRPGHGGHRRDKQSSFGQRTHRRFHPTGHRSPQRQTGGRTGPAQAGQFRHQALKQAVEGGDCRRKGLLHLRFVAIGGQNQIDRSVLQMQTPAVRQPMGLRPDHLRLSPQR